MILTNNLTTGGERSPRIQPRSRQAKASSVMGRSDRIYLIASPQTKPVQYLRQLDNFIRVGDLSREL